MIIHKVEQGTDQWLDLRKAKFTASQFATLMGKKENKGYSDELYRVAYEKITGERVEGGFKSAAMQRGNDLEPFARLWYETEKNVFVDEVGFIEHNEWIGYSPDGLVNDNGLIEIKCLEYLAHMDSLIKKNYPTKYRFQMQGGLWITEREYCDYVGYHDKLESIVIRVNRDEKLIKELGTRLNECVDEVQEIINKIKVQ